MNRDDIAARLWLYAACILIGGALGALVVHGGIL